MGTPLMQSWAEMIAAVGTGAGFLVAAAVYARAEGERRDGEAEQARLVYATATGDDQRQSVVVKNASMAPVYNVNGVAHLFKLSQDAPRHEEIAFALEWIDIMGPGEERLMWDSDTGGDQAESEEKPPIVGIAVEIYFADVRGLKWTRGLAGEPSRLTEPGRLQTRLRPVGLWLRQRRPGRRSSRSRR